MTRFRSFLPLFAVALLVPMFAAACGGDDDATGGTPVTDIRTPSPEPTKIGGSMILATTTSTADTGLLDALVPKFKEQTGIDVKVIAVGTGAALEMGARGDADGVLVHAPSSEKKYVDSGDLIGGRLVMHNDFVIVGPASDPARVKGVTSLKAALTAIAGSGPFISRGDDSGTHKKELEIWLTAGIDAKTAVAKREETGQGMGATLNVADQKNAYTLTDRGTYLALKKTLKLEILFEGDATLLNIYSVYVVSPAKHSGVKQAQAEAFAAFMVAPATQAFIGDFKKAEYGQALFTADAGKTIEQLTSR